MANATLKTKNWQKMRLGEIVDFQYGYTASAEEKNSGTKFLRITDIVPDLIDWETVPFCEIDNDKIDQYKLHKGDILVARTGATAGYAKLIRREPEKSVFASYLIRLKIKDKNISPEFAGRIIESDTFKQFVSAHKGGSAQPHANAPVLKNFEISVPPLPTQKQIADVLSAYDDLIENNTRRIKILEEIAQAIYRELLVPSASKKWKIVTLRDVIESYTGGGWGKEEPDKDYSGAAFVIRGTDIPHATIGNISTCPLRYHKLSNLRARVLRDGDLVFEVSGGSKGQPVGRSLLVTTKLLDQFNQKVICASFCKLIRPDKNKISPFQLHEQILSWYENGVIEKYQVQSTGISNFRLESFIDEEKMALPPEETRKKFDSLLSPLFDGIYSLGSQNQKLRQARDLLLPKLVTGEIRI